MDLSFSFQPCCFLSQATFTAGNTLVLENVSNTAQFYGKGELPASSCPCPCACLAQGAFHAAAYIATRPCIGYPSLSQLHLPVLHQKTDRDCVHSCQARMRASFPPTPLSMTQQAPSMCHPMESGESLSPTGPLKSFLPTLYRSYAIFGASHASVGWLLSGQELLPARLLLCELLCQPCCWMAALLSNLIAHMPPPAWLSSCHRQSLVHKQYCGKPCVTVLLHLLWGTCCRPPPINHDFVLSVFISGNI